MKLINPKISIYIDGTGARIEIEDSASSLCFVRVKLTPENFAAALGRLMCVRCEGDVYGLDKIGKTMELDTLEFPMPKFEDRRKAKPLAIAAARKACPKGWEADEFFNSQTSYFEKGGKQYGRTTIRRWVDTPSTGAGT